MASSSNILRVSIVVLFLSLGKTFASWLFDDLLKTSHRHHHHHHCHHHHHHHGTDRRWSPPPSQSWPGGTELPLPSYSIPVVVTNVAVIVDLASYSATTAGPVLTIDVTSHSRTVTCAVPYVDPTPCSVPKGPVIVVASCSIAYVVDPTPCSVPEVPIAVVDSSSITTAADPAPCSIPEGPITVVGSRSIAIIEVASNPAAAGTTSNPILYKGPSAVTCTTSSSADPEGTGARINPIPYAVAGTVVPA